MGYKAPALPTELRITAAFALAALLTAAATPIAIRLAVATKFYDHPAGYKAHDAPTPYLGGTAVLAGFLASALAVGAVTGDLWAIAAAAVAMWAVGTLDDRVVLGATVRVVAAAAAAVLLWEAGLGWSGLPSDGVELTLTVLWVVAVVNSINLFDNLDGAAGTVGAVCAAAIGVFAAVRDDTALACLSLALSGACLGFLPYNLSSPRARLFLGDGGSMMIGFVVAACAMAVPLNGEAGSAGILSAVMLVCVPLADTLLVIVSRMRRRVSVLKGGRDHLTHRLLVRLRSPRTVALVVGIAQAGLSVLAILVAAHGAAALAVLATAYGLLAALTIFVLERRPEAVLARSA
jgi:UDP-GlcNAc:undecaprenyl-phosphate/decaprenyl-phosphate GlcNAc-1-phosphate transferase